MKAFLLARVSTPEQKEAGLSLPSQLNRMQKEVERNGHEIYKEYDFDESAYKKNRKEFDTMLKEIENMGEPVALYTDKIDRLIRNFATSFEKLDDLRKSGQVFLYFCSDNLTIHKDSPAADMFRFNIGVGLAQYYSDCIRDNVKRAFERKIDKGEALSKVPMGYLNHTYPDGTKDVIVDERRAPLIREAFEKYSTGLWSMRRVAEYLNEKGLKTTYYNNEIKVRQIEGILKQTFYMGIITSKKNKISYPHRYRRIITEELFFKCQAVLAGKRKRPSKRSKYPFTFAELATCTCGLAITPEYKKGKYAYYHCTDYHKTCEKVWTPEFVIEEQVIEVLKNLELSEKHQAQILKAFSKKYKQRYKYQEEELNRLKIEHKNLESRKDSLLEHLLDGRITADKYDKKVLEFNARQQKIKQEIKDVGKIYNNAEHTAKMLLIAMSRLAKTYISSEVEEKRRLLKRVLQNFQMDGKKALIKLKTPYEEVLLSRECHAWSG